MWQALRSDFREFVSTVADDTSNVLAKMDATLDDVEDDNNDDDDNDNDNINSNTGTKDDGDDDDDDDDDNNKDMAASEEMSPLRGVNTAASIPPRSLVTPASDVLIDMDGNVAVSAAGFSTTGIIASPADEAARLASHEETYLEPLEVETDEEFAELKHFLANFNIEAKTEEITHLLQKNPDTLQLQFETLVPTQVKYEDFWQRYFFRCNVERIERQWEAEHERRRQARGAALTESLQSVRSLFGGALSVVSQSLELGGSGAGHGNHDPPVPASPFQSTTTAATSSTSSALSGLNIFGSSGRPPFVMNTAVDESVDEEDEEVEEELGWDDEEEEDADAQGEGDEEDGQVEEIDFKDNEKDLLQKQLAQAIEERDQLHETVELQRKQIAVMTGSGSDEVQQLRMELFEKDAELAALKASLEDTHDDDKAAMAKKDAAKSALQQREMERLSNELSERECELLELKQEFRKLRAEHQGQQQQHAVASSSSSEDTAKLAQLEQELVQAKQKEQAATTANQALQTELQLKSQQLDTALAQIRQLESRVQELLVQQQPAASTNTPHTTTSTTTPVVDSAPLQPPPPPSSSSSSPPVVTSNDMNVTAAAPHGGVESPDSTSSQVKVSAPGGGGTGGEEDDWGDDWGEDDEDDN